MRDLQAMVAIVRDMKLSFLTIYNVRFDARRKGRCSMDVIIGRYRACMEEEGLLLKHESGIQFDLGMEEILELLNFIDAYRTSLLSKIEAEDHNTREIKTLVLVENEARIRILKAQEEYEI
jgi:hypothetical protein